MLCKIADLIAEIPEVGGLAPHLCDYLCQNSETPHIVLDATRYDASFYPPSLSFEDMVYLESGRFFFTQLLRYNGFYLHASAVAYQGKGYLFSAYSGTGKSTHTRLWQTVFGEEAVVFNDDKTPLRCLDGIWYAYGAPWCGKDHINVNRKVPLGGICFLKRASENRIRRLSATEAALKILPQTFNRFPRMEMLDQVLSYVNRLVREIPVFELACLPDEGAAQLSCATLTAAAKEATVCD